MDLLKEINKIVPEDVKKQIQELAVKFSEIPAVAPAAPAPTNLATIETKLVDGTTLSVDKMEVGGVANIVSEAGTLPAMDGEYEAEDGTKITVAGGLITAITPKEVEAQPEVENPMAQAMAALTARLAAIETEFANVKTQNANLQVAMAQVNDATKVSLSAISSIISTPAGEPTQKPKTQFKQDNLSNLGDSIKNNLKK
jgi:hypothetical protein